MSSLCKLYEIIRAQFDAWLKAIKAPLPLIDSWPMTFYRMIDIHCVHLNWLMVLFTDALSCLKAELEVVSKRASGRDAGRMSWVQKSQGQCPTNFFEHWNLYCK